MIHETFYQVKYTGDVVETGDWVVWVRGDHISGDTACQGAAALAQSASRNDFVHGVDSLDDHTHDDLGGLVRAIDIDNDGTPELLSDIQVHAAARRPENCGVFAARL